MWGWFDTRVYILLLSPLTFVLLRTYYCWYYSSLFLIFYRILKNLLEKAIQGLCLVAQSSLTLCNPLDYSLPGSFVHRLFQAGILEWVAISSSRISSWPRDQTCVSCIGRQILYHLSHQRSSARDQTCSPCFGRWGLTTGPPGTSLHKCFWALTSCQALCEVPGVSSLLPRG